MQLVGCISPKPRNYQYAFRKSLLVPYWLVGPTADHALANMHVVPLKVSLSISAGMDDVLNVVTIATLQNNKFVNAGDELLVFDGELQEETRETVEPSRKRGRLAAESAQEKSDDATSPFAGEYGNSSSSPSSS